jgi:CheY-like chemotaxis protein
MRSGGVLLVEDSADDATFVRMAFKRSHVEDALVVVPSGLDAIEYLRGEGRYGDRGKHPLPVLMLLDLKMPIMDGFEVIQWVRGHERLGWLPIAVFTGSDYPQDRQRAYALGANSFLVKPTGLEECYRTITALIDFWLRCCQLPDLEGG